ncbi:hypothetical protein MKK65_08175 [Methylobacterium sp. J-001]|uniref:hypothetical protein n=1 Tax=Methylobacterium sp. J-001 TaxID=2836609 RepID=UPI001FBA12EF|nr:hypothetical protein [Methylobacterium sp. J-001]MCJ2116556.1 hypothetical protein [Methylobacterium sp. J-001]
MKSKTKTQSLAVIATEPVPDTTAVQAAIERRLAGRLRVSDQVAAVFASLAGIGPQMREAR